MIIQFSITNYGCFRDKQTFSMLAPDESLLKGAAVFGGNATGKSTFFQALLQLKNMVQESDRFAGAIPGYAPFALNKKNSAMPTRFELDFLVEGKRYNYCVAYTGQHIVEESLAAFSGQRPQKWFHRKATSSKSAAAYRWSFSRDFDQSDPKLKDRTQNKTLYLSVAGRWNHPQLARILTWFTTYLQYGGDSFASVLTNNTSWWKEKRKEIVSLLARVDPGIANVTVTEEPAEFISPTAIQEKIVFQVKGEKGKLYLLPYDEMSGGTRRYESLLTPLLWMLEEGGVVLMDELETSLHPMLLYSLVRLFLSEKTNPKGAQLIFSTHMSSLFSASADPLGDEPLLRRDQFWFTEKMHDGSSSLYPLTRYQTQENEALERRYLAGRYGGIPLIPEGDIL